MTNATQELATGCRHPGHGNTLPFVRYLVLPLAMSAKNENELPRRSRRMARLEHALDEFVSGLETTMRAMDNVRTIIKEWSDELHKEHNDSKK